jgi:SAM-dependent methyltransferase
MDGFAPCASGRQTRTGLRLVIESEIPHRAGRELRTRYSAADLGVFTAEEARRFIPDGDGDPSADTVLAWELLYRLDPDLYDQLASAERLHPGILDWLPRSAERIVEVGAGTGRLTLDLIGHGREVVAIEPAAPLRQILERKLADAGRSSVCVLDGFFDDLPLPSAVADIVVACSAFTPASTHGGEAGLAEMERVCRPGGLVAIIWPNNVDWLTARGYQYLSFDGPMAVEFPSQERAAELAEIFYPHAAGVVRAQHLRRVPFELIGINPPRDVAYKFLPR